MWKEAKEANKRWGGAQISHKPSNLKKQKKSNRKQNHHNKAKDQLNEGNC